jgi:hypothetical protein
MRRVQQQTFLAGLGAVYAMAFASLYAQLKVSSGSAPWSLCGVWGVVAVTLGD